MEASELARASGNRDVMSELLDGSPDRPPTSASTPRMRGARATDTPMSDPAASDAAYSDASRLADQEERHRLELERARVEASELARASGSPDGFRFAEKVAQSPRKHTKTRGGRVQDSHTISRLTTKMVRDVEMMEDENLDSALKKARQEAMEAARLAGDIEALRHLAAGEISPETANMDKLRKFRSRGSRRDKATEQQVTAAAYAFDDQMQMEAVLSYEKATEQTSKLKAQLREQEKQFRLELERARVEAMEVTRAAEGDDANKVRDGVRFGKAPRGGRNVSAIASEALEAKLKRIAIERVESMALEQAERQALLRDKPFYEMREVVAEQGVRHVNELEMLKSSIREMAAELGMDVEEMLVPYDSASSDVLAEANQIKLSKRDLENAARRQDEQHRAEWTKTQHKVEAEMRELHSALVGVDDDSAQDISALLQALRSAEDIDNGAPKAPIVARGALDSMKSRALAKYRKWFSSRMEERREMAERMRDAKNRMRRQLKAVMQHLTNSAPATNVSNKDISKFRYEVASLMELLGTDIDDGGDDDDDDDEYGDVEGNEVDVTRMSEDLVSGGKVGTRKMRGGGRVQKLLDAQEQRVMRQRVIKEAEARAAAIRAAEVAADAARRAALSATEEEELARSRRTARKEAADRREEERHRQEEITREYEMQAQALREEEAARKFAENEKRRIAEEKLAKAESARERLKRVEARMTAAENRVRDERRNFSGALPKTQYQRHKYQTKSEARAEAEREESAKAALDEAKEALKTARKDAEQAEVELQEARDDQKNAVQHWMEAAVKHSEEDSANAVEKRAEKTDQQKTEDGDESVAKVEELHMSAARRLSVMSKYGKALDKLRKSLGESGRLGESISESLAKASMQGLHLTVPSPSGRPRRRKEGLTEGESPRKIQGAPPGPDAPPPPPKLSGDVRPSAARRFLARERRRRERDAEVSKRTEGALEIHGEDAVVSPAKNINDSGVANEVKDETTNGDENSLGESTLDISRRLAKEMGSLITAGGALHEELEKSGRPTRGQQSRRLQGATSWLDEAAARRAIVKKEADDAIAATNAAPVAHSDAAFAAAKKVITLMEQSTNKRADENPDAKNAAHDRKLLNETRRYESAKALLRLTGGAESLPEGATAKADGPSAPPKPPEFKVGQEVIYTVDTGDEAADETSVQTKPAIVRHVHVDDHTGSVSYTLVAEDKFVTADAFQVLAKPDSAELKTSDVSLTVDGDESTSKDAATIDDNVSTELPPNHFVEHGASFSSVKVRNDSTHVMAGRSGHSCVVVGSSDAPKLVLFGGGTALSSTSPNTEPTLSVPSPDGSLAASPDGIGMRDAYLGDAREFDILTSAWRKLPASGMSNTPSSRAYATAICVPRENPAAPRKSDGSPTADDTLLLYGGWDGVRCHDNLHALFCSRMGGNASAHWSKPVAYGTSPGPRAMHAAVIVQGPSGRWLMVIYGGWVCGVTSQRSRNVPEKKRNLAAGTTNGIDDDEEEEGGEGEEGEEGEGEEDDDDESGLAALSDRRSGTFLGDCFALDIASLSWRRLSPRGMLIPDARGGHAMVVALRPTEGMPGEDSSSSRPGESPIAPAKRVIFCFGGIATPNGNARFGHPTNDLLVLDPVLCSWHRPRERGRNPSPRSGASIAAIHDGASLIVYGGHDGRRALRDCYRLDVRTTRWTELRIEDSIRHPPRAGHVLLRTGAGRAIAVGGWAGARGGFLSDVLAIDVPLPSGQVETNATNAEATSGTNMADGSTKTETASSKAPPPSSMLAIDPISDVLLTGGPVSTSLFRAQIRVRPPSESTMKAKGDDDKDDASFDPLSGVALSVRWFRSRPGASSREQITGAEGLAYLPVADDIGCRIGVSIMAMKALGNGGALEGIGPVHYDESDDPVTLDPHIGRLIKQFVARGRAEFKVRLLQSGSADATVTLRLDKHQVKVKRGATSLDSGPYGPSFKVVLSNSKLTSFVLQLRHDEGIALAVEHAYERDLVVLTLRAFWALNQAGAPAWARKAGYSAGGVGKGVRFGF